MWYRQCSLLTVDDGVRAMHYEKTDRSFRVPGPGQKWPNRSGRAAEWNQQTPEQSKGGVMRVRSGRAAQMHTRVSRVDLVSVGPRRWFIYLLKHIWGLYCTRIQFYIALVFQLKLTIYLVRSCLKLTRISLRLYDSADEKGGVTLQAFLDSEATIMPSLTRLRLLQ